MQCESIKQQQYIILITPNYHGKSASSKASSYSMPHNLTKKVHNLMKFVEPHVLHQPSKEKHLHYDSVPPLRRQIKVEQRDVMRHSYFPHSPVKFSQHYADNLANNFTSGVRQTPT